MRQMILNKLASIAKDAFGRHAVVLPSTADTTQIAADIALNGFIIVGNGGDGCLLPAQLYERLEASPPCTPFHVIAFTDQLNDAINAPLLIRHNGITEFRPSIEAILASRHGFHIHAWTGQAIEQATDLIGPAAITPALKLQSTYFLACEAFGDAWRMRHVQQLRMPALRFEFAQRRNRSYQSHLLRTRTHAQQETDRVSLALDQLVLNYDINRRNFKNSRLA